MFKNAAGKILFIILGIILALFISEISLRFFNYKPKKPQTRSFSEKFTDEQIFKWAHLDIENPFFDIKNGTVSIQREDLWIPAKKNKSFTLKKQKDKRRLFIIGESTAAVFDAGILSEELSKYFEAENLEIINCAMCSYDSYRIEKITEEIKKFEPDWVICLIGNNDGINDSFIMPKIDPVKINILPYKYKIFREIYVLNALTYLFPSTNLNKNTAESNFRENIIKIVKNLKHAKILFCDLPNNEFFVTGDIFTNIKRQTSKKINNGLLWKNNNDYAALLSRMAFLKKLPEKYDNVFIVFLTDAVKEFTNAELGYNVFRDNCHFTGTTYTLLSQLITQIIAREDLRKNIPVPMTKQQYLKSLKNETSRINPDAIEILPRYYCVFFDLFNRAVKYDDKNIPAQYYKLIGNLKNYKNKYADYLKYAVFADALQENGYLKEAEKILKNLIILSPDYYEAYLITGYIYYKQNNYTAADKYFDIAKTIEQNSEINVKYLNLLKQENENYET